MCIRDRISNAVEAERMRNRVSSREYMGNDGDDNHDFDGDDHDIED